MVFITIIGVRRADGGISRVGGVARCGLFGVAGGFACRSVCFDRRGFRISRGFCLVHGSFRRNRRGRSTPGHWNGGVFGTCNAACEQYGERHHDCQDAGFILQHIDHLSFHGYVHFPYVLSLICRRQSVKAQLYSSFPCTFLLFF